jgi:hypothetical protein
MDHPSPRPRRGHQAGFSDFNFTFTQNHMSAALSCQAHIALVREAREEVPGGLSANRK